MSDPNQVTQLLLSWREGDEDSFEALLPLVYAELRRIAGKFMRSERSGHTLQPTALVHEAYMRLVNADVSWADRTHFFAVAARAMRRILLDHAKGKNRQKRGGGALHVPLEDVAGVGADPSDTLIAMDEALDRLAEQDERKAKLVELHFFGGLTYDEMAGAMGISPATVHRDLRLAKAWLQNELK